MNSIEKFGAEPKDVSRRLPLLETSSSLRTAHYTGGVRENRIENTGENLPNISRTAHNTHSERLKRRKRTLPKYLIPEEKEALFRVIEKPRDRAIFRLAYHHGLRASEIGMIQMKDWRRGTSLDMDRLYLRRVKGSIGGETILVNAAATALRAWPRIRGTSSGPIFTAGRSLAVGSTSL